MSEQQPPKIEFPCDYPIKVMGDSADDFSEFVVEVMARHAGPIHQERVSIRASRNGRFSSVTVVITATGPDQLRAIHGELMASSRVKMVL